jgi:hypothetical protein
MPCFFKISNGVPLFSNHRSANTATIMPTYVSLLVFLLSLCKVESLPIFASMDVGVELRQKGKGLVTLINYSCRVWVYLYIQYNDPSFGSETLIRRQVTRHDCLPCWLGDGEEISFVPGRLVQQPSRQAQQSNQGRTPFMYFHWVPMCLSFNSRQGAPLSSLSALDT